MRGLLPIMILAGILGTAPVTAEFSISQIELVDGDRVHIVFGDSTPPIPYILEERSTLSEEAIWSPRLGVAINPIQASYFETFLESAIPDARFYRLSLASGYNPPLVIATKPFHGETGVPVDLKAVQVSFNRPMQASASILADEVWGGSYVLWSADRRTVSIYRFNVEEDFSALAKVRITLNPDGHGFVDDEGKSLAPCTFSFTTGVPDAEGPHVIASNPSSNATDVDPWLDTVEFKFSEPMLPTGGFLSSHWYPWTLTWSDDRLTAYLRRNSASTPFFSTTATFQPLGFYSLANEPMEIPYELVFRTADPPAVRVDPDPDKGFFWPYLLMIPPSVIPPVTLLVEPNTTGTWGDDPWFHEEAARKLLSWRSSFATELGSPLLVPVFPRPVNPSIPEHGGIYIHALDRYSLDTRWAGLQRIDLQMVAMIDDALERLRSEGYDVDDKVFMMGFSASGAFTSRFSAIHPERIKAAAPGSPGGWPIAPVSDWEGTSLKYPMGVEDLPDLTGQAFNLEAFRQVPFYIYIGDVDINDAFDVRGLTEDEKSQIRQFLTWPTDPILAHRWPLAQAIYDSVGSQAQFVTYPGVAHTITESMFEDIRTFFNQHR